jgi:hypothetical protein
MIDRKQDIRKKDMNQLLTYRWTIYRLVKVTHELDINKQKYKWTNSQDGKTLRRIAFLSNEIQ